MALFKKKPDPVSARAKDLDEKIAELEAQIKKLSEQPADSPEPASAPPARPGARSPGKTHIHAGHPKAPAPVNDKGLAPKPPSSIPNFTNSSNPGHPRLRSTTLPVRGVAGEPPAAQDPIFEELNQPEINPDATPAPVPPEDLGTRKSDFASLWQRVLRHFRGPVTSNPKLVNYLAAGSIQGLQPLRYEKRVARNRFIVFAAFLVLALWGLIVMLSRR